MTSKIEHKFINKTELDKILKKKKTKIDSVTPRFVSMRLNGPNKVVSRDIPLESDLEILEKLD